MPTLTIYRGISGSGKSTVARQTGDIVVSRDDIRDMLFPGHRSDPAGYYKAPGLGVRESKVTAFQDGAIDHGLKAGFNVIVDNTNIEMRYVKAIAKIGYRHGAEVVVRVFDVDLATAIFRDQRRGTLGGREVGSNVITDQYNRFKQSKKFDLEPVVYPKPYSGTPGKERALMVDIDGTLADMADKRGPYDLNVGVDNPRQVVIDAVHTLSLNYIIIIMSGRKTKTREETIKWLVANGLGWYDELFMRADDDNRADNLIKADLFDEFVRDNYDVQFVLDDRDQVVDMWRRMGLNCFQVQPGAF